MSGRAGESIGEREKWLPAKGGSERAGRRREKAGGIGNVILSSFLFLSFCFLRSLLSGIGDRAKPYSRATRSSR